MTLVTTPGAADADSYASVAAADAYFSSRGVTTWTGADSVKEAALRRATTYLDSQYRDRWVGRRANMSQTLAWPRIEGLWGILYDVDDYPIATDVIPSQVQRATFEAALLTLTGITLEPRLERGGAIKSISKGVGPLQKSVTYMDGATPTDRYTTIEGLLRGLVSGNSNVRLVRA